MLTSIRHAGWTRKICVLLTLCIVALLICSDVAAAQEGEKPYQPGRALRVTIWQEPDLSGDFSIDNEGFVILPLVERIQVSGYTKDSLESYLTSEYSNYLRAPIITVEPLIRVGVIGEVKEPGLYRVNPDSPLWDVIGLSGGPTPRANLKNIKIMRNGEIVSEDLLVAFERGASLESIGMMSGDQVHVPIARPMDWRTLIAFMSLGVSTAFLIVRVTDNK
jgi:polysaccharide export outer membrane protein